MVREVAVARALQVVVVGVLREPAVHERPRQVVDRVLLVLDRLRDDLGAHVVVEEVVEVRLDGERLVQELAVEELHARVAQQHALARVVDERTARAAHHLEDVGDRVVRVPERTRGTLSPAGARRGGATRPQALILAVISAVDLGCDLGEYLVLVACAPRRRRTACP